VCSSDPFSTDYRLDPKGRRILAGLSFEETAEFEELDARLPYDAKQACASSSSVVPLPPMEVRWLELYRKHRAAFDAIR